VSYRFGEIIKYDYINTAKALWFFCEKESYILSLLSSIETIESSVQTEFDISHPNITTLIAGYEYSNDTSSIDTGIDINLIANSGFVFTGILDTDDTVEVYDDDIVVVEFVDRYTGYLSKKFASKSSKEYTVSWTYRIPFESKIDYYDMYSDDDIPPYDVVSSTFYEKRLENFYRIYSRYSSEKLENAFTKYIGVSFFNERLSDKILCNTSVVVGDSLFVDNGTVNTSNSPIFKTNTIVFSDEYTFDSFSPISTAFSESVYALNTLSNVVSFFVSQIDIEARGQYEVVSIDNIDKVMSDLYNINDDTIYDNFKVDVSRGDEAVTFKALYSMCLEAINTFYNDKISIFLQNYDNAGPIFDMIAYIDSEIKNLTNNFVRSDECEIPLESSSQGCKIDCNNIHLDDSHEMVTKQKLKSIVTCLMKCDTMPYTEDELVDFIQVPYYSEQDDEVPTPDLG